MKEFILREWQYDDAKEVSIAANNSNIAKYLRNTFPHPYRFKRCFGKSRIYI